MESNCGNFMQFYVLSSLDHNQIKHLSLSRNTDAMCKRLQMCNNIFITLLYTHTIWSFTRKTESRAFARSILHSGCIRSIMYAPPRITHARNARARVDWPLWRLQKCHSKAAAGQRNAQFHNCTSTQSYTRVVWKVSGLNAKMAPQVNKS